MRHNMLYTLLLVEENHNSRNELKRVIKEHLEANILEADSGEAALELLNKNDIDIMLVNAHMSELDGFEVAERIKKNKRTENIPIIFLTEADTSNEFIEKSFMVGVVDYLSKPVNEYQLIHRLQVYLKMIEKERTFNLAIQEELRKANSVKDLFLANMSHELRTPMNGMMGMIQLLEFTKLDEEQQEILDMMKESSYRMMALLKNLIGITTLEKDMVKIQNNSFQVSDFIQNTMEPFFEVARNKKINLNYQLDSLVPKVIISDDEKIAKILTSLIDNAIKFTSEGSVSVEICTDGDGIDKEGNLNLIFTVKDTGIGIEKDNIDKLFRIFTQLDDTYTKKYQGAGLGLSISKKLVKILSGTLDVQSTLGKGSTFQVKLKVKEEAPPEKAKGSEKEAYKILAVDDDEVSLKLIKLLCRLNGYEIDMASCGKEALEVYQQSGHDIVFMDIQMPDMSGIEVAKRMRAIQKNVSEKTVIIAVTACALKGDKERFLSMGIDDYIPKPIDISLFSDILKKWTN